MGASKRFEEVTAFDEILEASRNGIATWWSSDCRRLDLRVLGVGDVFQVRVTNYFTADTWQYERRGNAKLGTVTRALKILHGKGRDIIFTKDGKTFWNPSDGSRELCDLAA